jgi:hypothetical protein
MTVKVIVKTREPGGIHELAHECEFTRVPTVGEHIWLPLYSDLIEYCFKVVYVAHKPFVTIFPKVHHEYSAYIYAVQEDVKESIKATGFYL